MTDEPGGLNQDEIEALNLFLNEKSGEEGLLCPLTGEQVPITQWNAPSSMVVLPGHAGGPGYEALPLTSPAGGVVLVSALKLREWQAKAASADKEDTPSE